MEVFDSTTGEEYDRHALSADRLMDLGKQAVWLDGLWVKADTTLHDALMELHDTISDLQEKPINRENLLKIRQFVGPFVNLILLISITWRPKPTHGQGAFS